MTPAEDGSQSEVSTVSRAGHTFYHWPESYRHHIAFYYCSKPESEELTTRSYAELDGLIDDCLQALNQVLDLKVKRLFFIEARNDVASLVAYLTVLRAGHSALLFDPAIDSEWLHQLMAQYRPNAVLGRANSPSMLPEIRRINDDEMALQADLAILLSTSGTTGSPKQVQLSYQNLQTNAESITQFLPIDASERAITSLPLHYSYGLSVVNTHLLKGAALVLTEDSFVSKSFWRVFEQSEATSLAGVPFQYQILKKLRFERMALPSLRYMTQAGGKLSQALVEEFDRLARQRGTKFFVMYGQTEATARMAYLPPECIAVHSDSIGLAIPGGEFYLLNDKGETVEEEDCVGELVYRGPNVMMGYAQSLDDLAKPNHHGDLHTGDLAYRNEKGLYVVTGRKNRLAKAFGVRLDLDELENRLREAAHQQSLTSLDVACVAVSDVIYICLVLADEIEARSGIAADTEALIRALMSEKIRLHASGYALVWLDAIPRTASDKVAYSRLCEELSAQELSSHQFAPRQQASPKQASSRGRHAD